MTVAWAHGWRQCLPCWNWPPRNSNSDSKHAQAVGFVVVDVAVVAGCCLFEPAPESCVVHDAWWLDGCDSIASAVVSADNMDDDGDN